MSYIEILEKEFTPAFRVNDYIQAVDNIRWGSGHWQTIPPGTIGVIVSFVNLREPYTYLVDWTANGPYRTIIKNLEKCAILRKDLTI